MILKATSISGNHHNARVVRIVKGLPMQQCKLLKAQYILASALPFPEWPAGEEIILQLRADALYRSLPLITAVAPVSMKVRPFRRSGDYASATEDLQGQHQLYNPRLHPKTVYHDSILNRILLTVLCIALNHQLRKEGQPIHLPVLCQYEDFVRVAKAIMGNKRTVDQQEALIKRALNSSIPGGSGLLRLLLGKHGGSSKQVAELNAWAASWMFPWLVGETEVHKTTVLGPDGNFREQASVLHIKKCRYLEASGCQLACLNLCKAPTQSFFTQEAGLPTTLEPDFSNLSCNIVFGQAPAARADDEAFLQPCFSLSCSSLLGGEQSLKKATKHDGHTASQAVVVCVDD
ncbi:hypothetical protein CEUSTIGMA_g3943.t1 [Chlamydomonas eustigma]|uniref:Beta-carotene isomerase D27-like C-terminal domain-containing protein n=1 Tax=Chlamydomonas eustigma TaxID=1157962 RepID=A0A250X096_9CHLO|nr:hypothetical protein CEUSTIGMA_g3943.t1 [Chlamydomonas eustigma]|eukprot:GAX76498.1 hypothetical protein CEUSTIGMA_g3943.t1 [Chlamydomonas eustigma]